MYRFDTTGQMTMLDLDTAERGGAPPKRRPGKPDSELVSIPYFHLDLLSSPVDLFGQRHWELRSPWREGKRPLNTGAAPRRPIRVSLSGILEAYPSLKYYLSKTACLGILRRAFERGKDLPKMLARALKIQAGLMKPDSQPTDLKAFHVNQRNEGIDLDGVSGALMATTNMQMQTFVTQPNGAAEGFDGYNGVMAFAANQRDEVRDLRDVAGALGAPCGMVLIAGTGSICFGRDAAGKTARSGGYGHKIDDEGSGYALGRDALAAVVRAQDGRGPRTLLTDLVFAQLKVVDVGGLVQFTYDPQTDKKQIAALAPLVARAYEAGDEAAKAVVEKACRELALLVEPVARALHMEDGVLALTGSILLRDKAVREGTAALLRMRFPGMRLAEPKSDAAAGAALLALETLNTEKGENKNA